MKTAKIVCEVSLVEVYRYKNQKVDIVVFHTNIPSFMGHGSMTFKTEAPLHMAPDLVRTHFPHVEMKVYDHTLVVADDDMNRLEV